MTCRQENGARREGAGLGPGRSRGSSRSRPCSWRRFVAAAAVVVGDRRGW